MNSNSDLNIIRVVPASRGIEWFREAWELFAKAPWQFIGWSLLNMAGSIGLAFIPMVGIIAQIFFGFCMTYGGLRVIRTLDQKGVFIWDEFTSPLKDKLGDIILYTILTIVPFFCWAILSVFGFLLLFGGHLIKKLMANLSLNDAFLAAFSQLGKNPLSLVFVFLIVMGLLLVVAFGMNLQASAPGLIALTNITPFKAIKIGTIAGIRNWKAWLVTGLVGVLCALGSVITLGLGLAVLYPLMSIVVYRAFRDIYILDQSVAAVASNNKPHQ